MKQKRVSAGLILSAVLALAGRALPQTELQSGSLRVSGLTGEVSVLRVNGRYYVEVGALARLTNASLSFKANHFTLTFPAATASTPAASPPTSQGGRSEFSKEFLRAGIEEMSTIREWRSALVNAVQNGYPLRDDFVADIRGQAATNLRLASVAVSTDSDRRAYQLLSNELNKMQNLSDRIMTARKNMNYVPRDALKGDPQDQQILDCARSLGSMAASGQFQEDGTCN